MVETAGALNRIRATAAKEARFHRASYCNLLIGCIFYIRGQITYEGKLSRRKMSKAVGAFVQKAQALKNAPAKFSASAVEGNRIIPSKTKDADFQLRIDAGRYDASTKHLNVVLQVNSQAKSPALKKWIKENSTHGKLATASFDTAAKDQNAEFDRVLQELKDNAKENLGS
ncbi:hypothetical protein O988_06178 [Pseudogymnoascus sp. VKM F-3808]|nr:hypothetical protein O988_06178 [Pseudogymnoascus sp. VKM F-3808]